LVPRSIVLWVVYAGDSLITMCNTEDDAVKRPQLSLPVRFELKSGRECTVRAISEDDAEELCTFLPQTHVESDFLHYLPGEFDWTVERERDFIRGQLALPCSILLCSEVEGRIVGLAGAAAVEYRRLSHHAQFGLAVLKEFWGQGLGRKLCECIEDWGKGEGLRKMHLRVFAHNERGIALYKSLGYVEEGRLKDDVLRGDGAFGDTIIMANLFVE